MKAFITSVCVVVAILPGFCQPKTDSNKKYQGPIFDVHLHSHLDSDRRSADIDEFKRNKVVEAAITCSWNAQEPYRVLKSTKFLYGMILPCPNGIVPYGGPKCFDNGQDFPDANFVRQQMRDGKIDFLGELLNQYYGISMSDSIMFPYYALAQEFNIPIAMHTGLAGPDHGCPNFDPLMGDPKLIEPALKAFPNLRIWLMHAGGPYLEGTLKIMSTYKAVYADISVIANPAIVPMEDFAPYMKALIDAGLGDRLMFGSDGGDIAKMIDQVNNLDFLTKEQKEKILYKNAKEFFTTK
jgi:hypothetical protein